MKQSSTLDLLLTDFCVAYNKRFPGKKISIEQFDILHEFVYYLKPIEECYPKKVLESVT